MKPEQIGELAALATALLWTLSSLAWTSAGRYVGALAVSFVRLVICVVFLLVYGQVVRGLCLPTDAGMRTWVLLGTSGFFGFFLADLCLFKSYLVIGPRLSLLIQSLVPPMSAMIYWIFSGDNLSLHQWIAMGITLAGIVWVVLEEPENPAVLGEPADDAPQSAPQKINPHTQGSQAWGLFLAFLSAVGLAIGSVLTKQGLGEYDAFAGTFIRVIGAMLGYVVLITVLRKWPAMGATFRQPRTMALLTAGASVGPFLGVALFLISLRHCHVGVVTTILSTMPVIVLPFVIVLYKEKVSLRAAGGALISVAGIALLMINPETWWGLISRIFGSG
jgi:drug/metabolite transporter (DMT)-like permease